VRNERDKKCFEQSKFGSSHIAFNVQVAVTGCAVLVTSSYVMESQVQYLKSVYEVVYLLNTP